MARNVNMTSGNLFKNMIIYTIPIILTGVLQMLFNAADLVVIGHFRGSASIGAVGATGSLINLIVNLFIGLSTGVSVVVANAMGAEDRETVHKTVHTAIPVALISGIFLSIVGFFLSKPLLSLMDTPAELIDKSALYMKIYFLGSVFSLVYNFGAAVLRAVGDTRGPLIYLTLGGAANVVLNIIFVTLFNMDVEGVAIATVVSQAISAILVVIRLVKSTDVYALELAKMKIYKKELLKIVKIGLPAGIQGSTFSISNVLIQSSINSFGASAVAGNAAASNIEGFMFIIINSFCQTVMNFTSQNVGAKQYSRINKILVTSIISMTVTSTLIGAIALIFSKQLLGIYIPDDINAVNIGMVRMSVIIFPYAICGFMDNIAGAVRGMGASLAAMLVSVFGVCGIRILWIYTVFRSPLYHSLSSLYVSYIISWTVTAIGHFICYIIVRRKLIKGS